VDKVAKEIEGLGTQMATIGANLSELQLATERMSQQVAAGQRGLSRMTDGKMAEESVQLAKARMRTESNLSLMTQARGLRKNLYGVLME
jgi:flagellin-like hook-associated protein FlgL